jgi:hypothetical protein
VLELDHDKEVCAGVMGALTGKLTEAFELAVALEKEVRSTALLRECAHRIAIDAHQLRTQVERLQDDLVGHRARS